MPGKKIREYKTPVSYGNVTYPNVIKFLHAFGLRSVLPYVEAERLLTTGEMTPTRLLNRYAEVRRLKALYGKDSAPSYGPAKTETTLASLRIERARSYNPSPKKADTPAVPLRKRITSPVVYDDIEYQNAEHLARSYRIDYTQMLALMMDGRDALEAFMMLRDTPEYTLPSVAVPLNGRTVKQWVRYETPFATVSELATFADMTPQNVAYRIKNNIPLGKPTRSRKRRETPTKTDVRVSDMNPTPHPHKKERFTMPKTNEQLYTVTHASTRYVRVEDRHKKHYELLSTRNAQLKPGDIIYGKRLSRQSVQFLNKVTHTMHMLRLIDIEQNRPFYASKEGVFFSGVLGIVDGELALEVGDQLTWLDPSDDTVYGIQYIDEDIS